MTFSVRWFWNWKTWNCQIVKVYSIGQSWIRPGHCCHCGSHGPRLTALAADDFSSLSLAVSCEGPRRLSCYYSTRGLPRHCPPGHVVRPRGRHLVILSPDVCLAPGGQSSVTPGPGSVTWCHVTCYTKTWHVTLTPSIVPRCHLFNSLELLISDPQEIIIRRPDRNHH